jgi:hypothetical protein
LALWNDRFVLRQAQHFAARLQRDAPTLAEQIDRGFRLALGRSPDPAERDLLMGHAIGQGLPSACRLLFNLNEFVFVD